MRIRSITFKELIFILLIVFSIVPDVGIKFSTFGFTWTIYRIYILLALIAVLLRSGKLNAERRTSLSKWIFLMALWLAYGIVLLFVGKYSELHTGFVELLSIFNGIITFYVASIYLKQEKNKELALKVLYWLLNVMLIIGLFEIITGKHWIVSAFHDKNSSVSEFSDIHQATGLMYNMNDFSALITCLSPVLLNTKLGYKRYFSFAGVLLINLVNDATACTLAILIFVLYYYLMIKGGKTNKARLGRILFWLISGAAIAFLLTGGAGLAKRNDFIGAVARQIVNAKGASGSLYARLIMYRDALRAWLKTGMLGMGPGGYTQYFTVNESLSGLVNPHGLILEILTEYGVIIAAWFLGLLVWMFINAKKKYISSDTKRKKRSLIVLAFLIIYVIASFAPSSFIGYSYQWILIAIMSSLLDKTIEFGGISIA